MVEAGVVGYGVYVPSMRIKASEIAKVWGKDDKRIVEGLGIKEKSVASFDEDATTIAVEAARRAVEYAGIDAIKIGAVFVGSESKPYAVKPIATTVADAIGSSPEMTAADFEFACKAGTAAIQACAGMVAGNIIEYGLAIGADTAQGSPNNALEYSAGGGGGAYIIGKKEDEVIARIEDTYSFTTDTPDFWRRSGESFPQAAGRFTGEPAYFKHVISAAKGLLKKVNKSPKDYAYAVFHQPNAKFPVRAAKILGFTEAQIEQGLVVPFIGNLYSGSSLVGLASVLDVAKPGEKIFVVSYGSGAGSDAFSLEVTEVIKRRKPVESVKQIIEKDRVYIDYSNYVKHRRKLKSL